MTEIQAGSDLAGRYHIEAQLGEGGMAVVYRAFDLVRRVRVAIKLLKADFAEDEIFLQRFRREARSLQRLQHPNIVRFYEFGQENAVAFMVLDYIDGVTLRTLMRQFRRPLAPGEVLSCLRPICAALSYAHSQEMVHCDIKPANVLINRAGQVFLSDFGIARLSESATVTFSTPGTAAFMAPEQWRGGEDVSPATDIYALGVVLYQMLTGLQPFTGETIESRGNTREKIMREHFDWMPPAPSQPNPALPPNFDPVILRCLAKEPERRYQSADELLADFEAACQRAGQSPIALLPATDPRATVITPSMPSAVAPELPAAGPASPTPTRPHLTPAVLTVGGTLGIGLLLMAIFLLAPPRPPAPTATALTQLVTVIIVATPTTPSATTGAIQPTVSIASATPNGTSFSGASPVFSTIPLASIANASPAENFTDPPLGDVVFGGIPFHFDGNAFKTQASTGSAVQLPTQATLAINQSGVQTVYVLLSAGNVFSKWLGQTIGQIQLHFADGTSLAIDLVAGKNIREWHAGEGLVSAAPDVIEVWRGAIAGTLNSTGSLDMLSIGIPAEKQSQVLLSVEIDDESTSRLNSLDPGLNVFGATLARQLVETPVATLSPTLLAPTATRVGCALTPNGAFATLWSANQTTLGCPKQPSPTYIQDAEQAFQHGHMFWRADLDIYYVVYESGSRQGAWTLLGGKYNQNGLAACPENAPAGLVKPIRGFGNVWCGLGGANADIGWGLQPETGFAPGQHVVRVQDFQHGTIYQDSDGTTRGLVYLFFDSGRFLRVRP